MKEYLVKDAHGKYKLTDHHSGFDIENLIEVPEKYDAFIELNSGEKVFYKWHTNGHCLVDGSRLNLLEDFVPKVKCVLWKRNNNITGISDMSVQEYLTKNSSGNYQLVNHCFSEGDIKIPEGANYAATNGRGIFFSDKNDFIPELVVWVRESLNDKIATAEVARQEEKHSHYKKDVSHLKMIDPYRIADLYDLHPCAEHIMKKSLCAGNRGHKDMLRDIQDIIDTAERWKQMIEEDSQTITLDQ